MCDPPQWSPIHRSIHGNAMRNLVSFIFLTFGLTVGAQGFNVVDLPANYAAGLGVSVREVPEGFLLFNYLIDSSLVYRAHTALFSPEGELLWEQSWVDDGPSIFGYYDAVSKSLPDGGFLASVAVHEPDSDRWRAYRFNAQYDTGWTRTLRAGYVVLPRPAAYQAGSSYYSALVLDSLGGHSKAWVMRLDDAGNILTTGEFPQIEYDMLTLSAGAGTDILLAGGRPDSPFPYQSVVMRLDTALNVQWYKYIVSTIPGFTTCSSFISKITHDADGDIVVAGGLIDEAEWPYTNAEFYMVKLARMNGDVIWAQRLSVNSTDIGSLNDLECLPGGDLVTCGNVTPYDTSGWRAVIYRYMPDGQERWHRYYSFLQNPDAVHDLMDVESTTDGGFVLIGTARLNLNYPTVAWVLRLDQYGCLEPGCQSVGINDLLVGLPEEALRCSPVPAEDHVNVTVDLPPEVNVNGPLRLVITNLEGRNMLQAVVKGPYPIVRLVDVSSWSPGTYVVHVADGMRLLGSRKIVVQ